MAFWEEKIGDIQKAAELQEQLLTAALEKVQESVRILKAANDAFYVAPPEKVKASIEKVIELLEGEE